MMEELSPFEWTLEIPSIYLNYGNSTHLIAQSLVFPNQPSEQNKAKCYWYMNIVGIERHITLNLCLAQAKNADYFWTEFEVSLRSDREEYAYFSSKNLFHINWNKERSCKDFTTAHAFRELQNKGQSKLVILCKMKVRVERCIIDAAPKEIPDFEKLLDNSESSDCMVKTDSGKTFKAHKCILWARSTVFAEEIKDMQKTELDNIPIKNFDDEVVQEFLRFLYCGRVENLDKLSEELLKIGDFFNVRDLINMCLEDLCKKMSVDNALQLLYQVDYHEFNDLVVHVLNFIVINIKSIDKSQMKSLPSSMLQKIIERTAELLL